MRNVSHIDQVVLVLLVLQLSARKSKDVNFFVNV